MQIRQAHPTDAVAVDELLHQLGYAQDGTTATRIQSWGDDPSSAVYVVDADGQPAHDFYRHRGYLDQTGRSSRFLRDLEHTSEHSV